MLDLPSDEQAARHAVSEYASSALPLDVILNELTELLARGPDYTCWTAGILLQRALETLELESKFSTSEAQVLRDQVLTQLQPLQSRWKLPLNPDLSAGERYRISESLAVMSACGLNVDDRLSEIAATSGYPHTSSALAQLRSLPPERAIPALQRVFCSTTTNKTTRYFAALHLFRLNDLSTVPYFEESLSKLPEPSRLMGALELSAVGSQFATDVARESIKVMQNDEHLKKAIEHGLQMMEKRPQAPQNFIDVLTKLRQRMPESESSTT